jgi:signal transduction histidine kinase
MAAIVSLPLMAFWAVFSDRSPHETKTFRLLLCLATTLVLGGCVFARQFVMDRELVRLLKTSRESFENLARLQSHLVQKEKLASLGQVVAGAAHDINSPLSSIAESCGSLTADGRLSATQRTTAEKIGQQARRTQALVSNLLSFAHQAPSEKAPVEIGSLLQRVVQMALLRLESKNIRVTLRVERGIPAIVGNANLLFQSFLHIVENAEDALEEVGGGDLLITARREHNELVTQFADSGRGIRQPQRVFDPFYTTKPIGKGTGLGLSATYGVVQDHGGQINCYNRAEGGAVFAIRLPIATEAANAAKA